MNKLTESLVRHSFGLAKEIGARAVMFSAAFVEGPEAAAALLAELRDSDVKLVLVTPDVEVAELPKDPQLHLLNIPRVPLTRIAQIKIALLIGVAEKLFTRGDVVLCLSGMQSSGRLDLLAALRVGDEPEIFSTDELNPLPPDVQPAVFEKVLGLASELAAEGREQRPVGAIFVVGDADAVLENSRQLVFNPFKGYSEDERNILTGELDETIKEFAAIDGAFVIRGDGVLLAAGRYLMPKGKPAEPLRSGLGARHEAAAAITAVTDAVAIALSQSTATITLYNSGRVMSEIERGRGEKSNDND